MAVSPYHIPRVKSHGPGPVPFVQAIYHQAVAVLGRAWTQICPYKIRDTSDSPYALALLDRLALSSTSVLSGAKFVKREYYDTFVAG